MICDIIHSELFMNKIIIYIRKARFMATKKSTAKKGSSKKSSKTTAKATVKKNNQNKKLYATYIISSMLITLLLAVFMYIDTGNGGVINNAVKNLFRGLFGHMRLFCACSLCGCIGIPY